MQCKSVFIRNTQESLFQSSYFTFLYRPLKITMLNIILYIYYLQSCYSFEPSWCDRNPQCFSLDRVTKVNVIWRSLGIVLITPEHLWRPRPVITRATLNAERHLSCLKQYNNTSIWHQIVNMSGMSVGRKQATTLPLRP